MSVVVATVEEVVSGWSLDRDAGQSGGVVAAAQDGLLGPPDLRARLLSSTGDTISVQVFEGTVPVEPDALLYVEHRGAYVVLRREMWPEGRDLLTLAAWPYRRDDTCIVTHRRSS